MFTSRVEEANKKVEAQTAESRAKELVTRIANETELITKLIGEATLDRFSHILMAQGLSMHGYGQATKRCSDIYRRWAHEEAINIKNTHSWWGGNHVLNIIAGGVQTGTGLYFMGQQGAVAGNAALTAGQKAAEYRRISGNQTTGSNIGQFVYSGGNAWGSKYEADRTIANYHQRDLEQQTQTSGHTQAQQQVASLHERTSQADKEKSSAFQSMGRS